MVQSGQGQTGSAGPPRKAALRHDKHPQYLAFFAPLPPIMG
jgi:hypothetical protein